jgi:sterol desaturase/sphingolipid hydroxylase (fatty acid hydroxylase superfamily)
MFEVTVAVFQHMLDIYSREIPIMLGLAVIFTILTVFESQASSPGKVWWRNPGLRTDICYSLMHSVASPYLRIPSVIVVVLVLRGFMSPAEVKDYFENGAGPLSGLSFWWQAVIYLLLADFMAYWIHRGFHNASLWRYHAIHHSSTQVDWTSTYRFHPVNIIMQQSFVATVMVALGIKPEVMVFFVAWDVLSAAFVHANVNWSFGPLKYVIATPVFHRWHHGPVDDGGSSNFAPTFAFWDVLFGTFYMPEGRLPQEFGVDDKHFPEGFLAQMVYPFTQKDPDPAPASAPGPATPAAG